MVFQQAACAGSGNFKAALLLPRAVDADGWTKAGYAGLLLIEKELQAEIAYSESVPEEEFEQVFRQYAQEDFDFIIGHGGQFVSAAEIVAEEFPRTKFAVVTKYAGNNKNLGALFMREGELSYLVGVIAALKTETGKIGYAGGERYAVNVENAELFERGGKDTNPDIQVVLEWAGTWTDQQKIEQMAQQQIDSGADVLSVNAGQG
ncbi:MAG: BMP family ABC transporter substrate-binding protein, partial [bacterium]|nr:BMP family ABC transporter substrate-binding protein [bacterium]